MVTFKNIDAITRDLGYAYSYIVVPKTVLNTPVTVDKFELVDENGDSAGYGTINELSAALGSTFTPVPRIDDRFSLFRWLIKTDMKSESEMNEFMLSNGLVSMQVVGGLASDIDYDALTGNEYGVFDAMNIQDVKQVDEGNVVPVSGSK